MPKNFFNIATYNMKINKTAKTYRIQLDVWLMPHDIECFTIKNFSVSLSSSALKILHPFHHEIFYLTHRMEFQTSYILSILYWIYFTFHLKQLVFDSYQDELHVNTKRQELSKKNNLSI